MLIFNYTGVECADISDETVSGRWVDCGGPIVVDQLWWTNLVDQLWWTNCGGPFVVEQLWWNNLWDHTHPTF
jgi:hypothetical protein